MKKIFLFLLLGLVCFPVFAEEMVTPGQGAHYKGTLNSKNQAIVCAFDGSGSAITSGGTWYLSNIPVNATITGWNLVSDVSGSIVIDVWKSNRSVPTVSNTITASSLPTLSSQQSVFNGSIFGWTTAVQAGDVIACHINSASTVTKASLTINLTIN